MSLPCRHDPPFRAEHIGSLLRPRALKDAHRGWQAGTVERAAYEAVLARSVVEAIEMQEQAGLRVVTDGEFRRSAWFSGLIEALDGLDLADSLFRFRDAEGGSHGWRTCRATAPVRRRHGIATDEYDFVRAHSDRLPKVTLPSPSALHFFRGRGCVDPDVYPDLDRFWDHVVAAYRAEIAALAARGATYVQIDEVPLAMLCDETVRAQARGYGEDPDSLVDTYVDVLNRALEGRPETMCVGIHLCRGNFRGRWMAEGGYEPVAEMLFNKLAVDGFLLEFDTPRAGGFEPLRLVPDGKMVVLGLIGTKSGTLEEVDSLRRRIDEAAHYVPMERLALSPQCGFASVAGGNLLTEDEQRAKLALVVDVAGAVWGDV